MFKDKKRKRIVIGSPVYGDVPLEVLEDWCRWFYHLGRRMPDYDFMTAFKPKTEQFRARNAIVDGARQFGADYLLMIDDDMILDVGKNPTHGIYYNLIEKLLSHKKDICGVLYWQRGGECRPVAMQEVPTQKGSYRYLRDEEITYGLQEVAVAGGGCLLIDMKIFNKIKEPYFAPEFKHSTDIQLCEKARDAGFRVFMDSSIELGHLKQSKSLVVGSNRHLHQIESHGNKDTSDKFIASDIYRGFLNDVMEYTGIHTIEMLGEAGDRYMQEKENVVKGNYEWYMKYKMERVARQAYYNTQSAIKVEMTTTILQSIVKRPDFHVLDFGCGVGIPAFEFAKRGFNVTALDLKDTGPFDFLKWRAKKHGINIRFIDSEGGVPTLPDQLYNVIVAMDSIEHIKAWKKVIKILSFSLAPGGAFFANNGFCDDVSHPEHYDIIPQEFMKEMIDNGLIPMNPMTYAKPEEPVMVQEVGNAEKSNTIPGSTLRH